MPVARPVMAERTLPLLEVMPDARRFMKSGIYESALDKGPVSGTEKPMISSICCASARASASTLPLFARMPAAIWLQISAPQV